MTSNAVSFGVDGGTGAAIVTRPLDTPSSCGGMCESGHMEWKQAVSFGTFTVRARWFAGNSVNVSTADGFIGLFGVDSGSITFMFHGKGWQDGSGDDYAHTFQSEVYRTGQSHHKTNTKVEPDLHK